MFLGETFSSTFRREHTNKGSLTAVNIVHAKESIKPVLQLFRRKTLFTRCDCVLANFYRDNKKTRSLLHFGGDELNKAMLLCARKLNNYLDEGEISAHAFIFHRNWWLNFSFVDRTANGAKSGHEKSFFLYVSLCHKSDSFREGTSPYNLSQLKVNFYGREENFSNRGRAEKEIANVARTLIAFQFRL